MAKRTSSPAYDAAAAYGPVGGDPTAATDPAAGGAPPDGSDPSAGGQPLTIPPDQVAQLVQIKQSGDMAALGQAVAQLLP